MSHIGGLSQTQVLQFHLPPDSTASAYTAARDLRPHGLCPPVIGTVTTFSKQNTSLRSRVEKHAYEVYQITLDSKICGRQPRGRRNAQFRKHAIIHGDVTLRRRGWYLGETAHKEGFGKRCTVPSGIPKLQRRAMACGGRDLRSCLSSSPCR